MSTNTRDTHTHTHTDCANPVPVNCSVLESLGRHQRAWAASCAELQIPSRLNVDAWPSRLDQPLIHSLGPGNYWVSTEPHADSSNAYTHKHAHRTGWGGLRREVGMPGHRNARHVCRLQKTKQTKVQPDTLIATDATAGQYGWHEYNNIDVILLLNVKVSGFGTFRQKHVTWSNERQILRFHSLSGYEHWRLICLSTVLNSAVLLKYCYKL